MISAANFQLGGAEQFYRAGKEQSKVCSQRLRSRAGTWLSLFSANPGLNVFTNKCTKPRCCQTTERTALAAAALSQGQRAPSPAPSTRALPLLLRVPRAQPWVRAPLASEEELPVVVLPAATTPGHGAGALSGLGTSARSPSCLCALLASLPKAF